MKNSIFIIFFILYKILFLNSVFAKEIEFDASEIEITNNQNLTIVNNGIAKIKEDEIVIEGIKIEYYKDKSLIIVRQGKISKIDLNLEIKSDKIEYNIENEGIDFTDKVRIDDKKNNLIIFSDKIYYDIVNQKILGKSKSEIIDEFDNTYELNKF